MAEGQRATQAIKRGVFIHQCGEGCCVVVNWTGLDRIAGVCAQLASTQAHRARVMTEGERGEARRGEVRCGVVCLGWAGWAGNFM